MKVQCKRVPLTSVSAPSCFRLPGLQPFGNQRSGFWLLHSSLPFDFLHNKLQIQVTKQVPFGQTCKIRVGPVLSEELEFTIAESSEDPDPLYEVPVKQVAVTILCYRNRRHLISRIWELCGYD